MHLCWTVQTHRPNPHRWHLWCDVESPSIPVVDGWGTHEQTGRSFQTTTWCLIHLWGPHAVVCRAYARMNRDVVAAAYRNQRRWWLPYDVAGSLMKPAWPKIASTLFRGRFQQTVDIFEHGVGGSLLFQQTMDFPPQHAFLPFNARGVLCRLRHGVVLARKSAD